VRKPPCDHHHRGLGRGRRAGRAASPGISRDAAWTDR
jgi:hypothetical protein